MENIMKKQNTENTNKKAVPRTVIAEKLRRTIELIDRDGNVIKREVQE